MSGETKFLGAGLSAGEEVGSQFETEPAGERAGDELSLVVAAFAKPRFVEGHGDNDAGFEHFRSGRYDFREAGGKPIGKRSDSVVFYEKDSADHRVVVIGKAAGEVE